MYFILRIYEIYGIIFVIPKKSSHVQLTFDDHWPVCRPRGHSFFLRLAEAAAPQLLEGNAA
jgi:hypothetical protein